MDLTDAVLLSGSDAAHGTTPILKIADFGVAEDMRVTWREQPQE